MKLKKTADMACRVFVIGFVILVSEVFACDPNDPLPAALPPAPNGGIVAEAEAPMGAGESESEITEVESEKVYWEGTYDWETKRVTLHLLQIVPPITAIFSSLSPKEYLSNVSVRIERPREKLFEDVSFVVGDDSVVIDYDTRGISRFIVHVSAAHMSQIKTAEIQIEEE